MIKNKKGIIQVIHGMSEYKERYNHFFEYFEERGWIVVLEEHIYHGERVSLDKIGMFKDDFYKIIENQINFTKFLKNKYPNLPIFIFGHSMGSFIAQEHMKVMNNLVSGYILCGSCYKQKFLWKIGKHISIILNKFYKNKRAKIIKKLIFFNFNGKIKSKDYFNENSWLSRDTIEVKKYTENKYCGFAYSSSFYKDFFIFLNKLYEKKDFENIRKNLPILIISGNMDPVGINGKGVKRLENFYDSLGFKNKKYKIYNDARHELCNEINRSEVFKNIENWLDENT